MFFNSDPGNMSIRKAVAALCGMSVYTSLNQRRSGEVSGKPTLKNGPPAKVNGEKLLNAAVRDLRWKFHRIIFPFSLEPVLFFIVMNVAAQIRSLVG